MSERFSTIDDSQKIENTADAIVLNVKYVLESPNYQEALEDIKARVDAKDNEIREICSANQSNFLQNLKDFTGIKGDIFSIQKNIQDFENEILVILKTKKYNSTEENNLALASQNIKATKELLIEMQDVVMRLTKALDCLKSNQYMACLRFLDQIKKKQIFSHAASASLKQLMVKIRPIIINRIRGIIDEMTGEWFSYLQSKQSEFATMISNQIEESMRRKSIRHSTMSLAGKGRASNMSQVGKLMDFQLGGGNRVSQIGISHASAATSVTKKSTLYGIGKNFNSALKMTDDQSKRDLQLDMKLNLYVFNQCRLAYENLNETDIFFQNIKTHRKKQLLDITEAKGGLRIHNLRDYLSEITAFFLIEKDLERQLKIIQEIDQYWIEAAQTAEDQINKAFEKTEKVEEFLSLKSELQIFVVLNTKYGFNAQTHLLNDCIKKNFIRYSEKLLAECKKQISDAINNDNLDYLVAKNPSELKEYVTKFDLENYINVQLPKNIASNFKPLYLNYTLEVPKIGNLGLQYVNDNYTYMEGSADSESLLLLQLDRFFYEVYNVFYQRVNNYKLFNIIQLALIYQNANFIQHLSKFLKVYLEKISGNRYFHELEAVTYFDQIKVQAEEAMTVLINDKIASFLSYYEEVSWTPSKPNTSAHDLMKDMITYLNNIFNSLKEIHPEIVSGLVYFGFKFINQFIMDVIVNQVTEFNMIAMVNLEYDIVYLFDVCATTFRRYENLRECLREVRQLLDLFLVGKPVELLDLHLRHTKYSHLKIEKLITIFPKYKKIIYPKVPVLRKRDVDSALKKLKDELKIK